MLLDSLAEAPWVTSSPPPAPQRVPLGRPSAFPLRHHQLSAPDAEILAFVARSCSWRGSSPLSGLVVQESSPTDGLWLVFCGRNWGII